MNAQLNPPQPTPSDESVLPGVNVLLEGPTGTGKTYSIGTLVDTGVEVFFLGLEAGMESLLGYWTDRGLPVPENLHWHVLNLTTGSAFKTLQGSAQLIGAQTQESLYKMQDFTRGQNNPMERLLGVMNDFVDQRTGGHFGAVDSWGPNRCLVIDGLTGLSDFAMQMVIGTKPIKSQTDWGIAQDMVYRFLKACTDASKCHFVLIAHIERETDQVLGGVKITVATLGKALPPKIPPMFSDVIFAYRQNTSWLWSTANNLVDLKTRNLPVQENLPPTFGAIIEKWKSRGGRFSAKVRA